MLNVAKPEAESRFATLWPPFCKTNMTSYLRPICIKLCRPMQNHMPITVKCSKSKPEVEFQYGGRLFSATESSNISAVDWNILSKFSMLIALDLLIYESWRNQKPWQFDMKKRLYSSIISMLEVLNSFIKTRFTVKLRESKVLVLVARA